MKRFSVIDDIEEYDGEEVMNGKAMTYKMKKTSKAWSDGVVKFNGKKPKGKGKNKANPFKNTKHTEL